MLAIGHPSNGENTRGDSACKSWLSLNRSNTGYKFVRRWHQRTGPGVWRWRSGSQSTRLSSTVSGSLTVRISGSAGTWTRVTRFTGATACLPRCWPSYSTPIKWQRGSPLDEKAFISWCYSSLSMSVGWFRRSTRSGTWNLNYLRGLKSRARLPMSCIVRFAIRFGIQWYRNFWHVMFISDFIAEYLSIIFFRTPCMTLWNVESLKPIGYIVWPLHSLKVRNPFLTLTWPGDLTFGDLGLKFVHKVSNSIVNSHWKNGGAARRHFSAIREKQEGRAFSPSSAHVKNCAFAALANIYHFLTQNRGRWRHKSSELKNWRNLFIFAQKM